MALIAKDTGSGDFERAPQGTHLAICYMVADIGLQAGQYGAKHKVVIGWELPHEKMSDGRPFACSQFYTLSLSSKAVLRRDLESWRSRPFTEQELEGFDMKNILGKPCQVTIVHEVKGEKTYENVIAVTAVAKGMQIPERVNDLIYYEMEAPDPRAFEKLPEWIRKKIMAAVQPSTGPDERNPPPADFDDDIPF